MTATNEVVDLVTSRAKAEEANDAGHRRLPGVHIGPLQQPPAGPPPPPSS